MKYNLFCILILIIAVIELIYELVSKQILEVSSLLIIALAIIGASWNSKN